jgi:glycogen operon protein
MYQVKRGYPRPLGAVVTPQGVNFSLYSRYATGVQLLFFEAAHSEAPYWVYDLDPEVNRTYDYWHVYVQGVGGGLFYAYRVDGPWNPREGHRYNWNKVVVDPYALGYVLDYYSRLEACHKGDNIATAPKGVVVDLSDYDWEGDQPINRPMNETIIYEMHVRGFTRDESSQVERWGTYHGLIEKIPYLVDLGITAVELLPVHEFDQTDVIRVNPLTRIPLLNYWGYTTVGFFAPESWYSHQWDTGQQVREFRDMVKALHRAGIEVILDVVYNHTTEGNEYGPTLSFRGIDNKTYYLLDSKGRYLDYSGTGSTLNTNHPVVRTMILDSLRYWVQEMHIDGFRFDLASILSRDEDGNPISDPPIIWEIENDPILRNTKLIAEAWDAGGLYQVGGFPGYRWAEWNGRFRDDLRSFMRGDEGYAEAVAHRIAGSHDIYAERRNLPTQSINFITCHDGFTLNDLVTYNEKHNYFNGEDNLDGSNDNRSWNCGVEGDTDDPEIEGLRRRQIKNFIALLMVSQGTPMILAGDEMRRTQLGNNNAYCQDNQISWVDWTLLEVYPDIYNFFRGMIALRKAHPIFRRERHFIGETDPATGFRDIEWHGVRVGKPDFTHYSHSVAFTLAGMGIDNTFYVVANAYWEGLDFELPKLPGGWLWVQAANTGMEPPRDIYPLGQEKPIHPSQKTVHAGARSVVILMSNQK